MNRERDPRRWRVLALLAVAELLGMSLWFTATAVSGDLGARWSLSPSQVGWLATAVNLGFVAGTALSALLNLADIVQSRLHFAVAATLAALANAAVLAVPGFAAAVTLRFATGFLLAGVYPTAMKMAATWFRSGRGLAIGTIVGALTVGKATPYLIDALPGVGAEAVIAIASVGAGAAALLVLLLYRDGPHPFARAPFSWGLVARVVRHRPTRLAIAGYLGHMWELYAMWAWAPAFLAASAIAAGTPDAPVGLAGFATLAVGALGCLWGGWAADRIGRRPIVNRALAISGACCLLVGLLYGAPFPLVVAATLVWGFFVVADSAQFSAMVTERAPREAAGTALTLQTCAGFLLAAITVQIMPLAVEAVGWRWAFALLALGPLAGIRATRRLSARGKSVVAIAAVPLALVAHHLGPASSAGGCENPPKLNIVITTNHSTIL